jgi:7-cyano-7-deazaguanine synthase
MDNKHVVMALSGGLDSTVMLAHYLSNGYTVDTMTFTYGSKHNSYENEAAKKVCEYYNLQFNLCDLSNIIGTYFKSNLLKSGGAIPEGHYTDKSMETTVVPSRNIIFLSILSGFAWSVEASKVAIGIHAGDHAIYPDCRPDFYKAMDNAIYLGTDRRVEMEAPFVNIDKGDIFDIGMKLNAPIHLTRTCYKDQPLACGKCGSCVERIEAAAKFGHIDPIEYEK